MENDNKSLPAAADSHQPCECGSSGVGRLLAALAAVCVGMWWFAPDISVPLHIKQDAEFYSECSAAAKAHTSIIVTTAWILDTGTCRAHLIFEPGFIEQGERPLPAAGKE